MAMNVGIVGSGAISRAYLNYAQKFDDIEIVACSDLKMDAAKEKAAEFGITAMAVDALLGDDEIELVLNLTVPKAHVEIGLRAVEAGKHTYAEKPLGVDREQGRQLIETAASKGVRVGCAPDTFFGAGLQTARTLIDDGAIGRPVAATAFMMGRGHESWHPNPEFYYEPGGGPMFDMGPYYLTALLQLLGEVERVAGSTSIAITPRTITHKGPDGGPGPKHGKRIDVETPDHITGTMEFAGGAIATVTMSFAAYASPHPPITVFGTEGTVAVPDPNGFDGEVKLWKPEDREWKPVPHTHMTGYGRAAGVAEMAWAIRNDRPHRASGEQAMHVLDAMAGFLDAGERHTAIQMSTPYERPPALPAGDAWGKWE